MFRRRRTNEKASQKPVVAAQGEVGGSGIWYKSRSSVTKPPGGPTDFNSPPTTNVPHPTGSQVPGRHSPEAPTSPRAVVTSHGLSAQHSPSQLQSLGAPPHGISSPTGRFRESVVFGNKQQSLEKEGIETAELVQMIMRKEWNIVCQQATVRPDIVRCKTTQTLWGQATTTSPLHLAVARNPPAAVVEHLLRACPNAIELPDESNGRLPLHWACIAGVQLPVLRRLIESYPDGTKMLDKSHGRSALHYVVMHATLLEQVKEVLEVYPQAAKIKDKSFNTPVDLAQSTSNPLKLSILAELRKTQSSKRSNQPHPTHAEPEPPQWEGQESPEPWESPMGRQPFRPPGDGTPRTSAPEYSVSPSGINTRSSVPRPAPTSGGFLFQREMAQHRQGNNYGVGQEKRSPGSNVDQESPAHRRRGWGLLPGGSPNGRNAGRPQNNGNRDAEAGFPMQPPTTLIGVLEPPLHQASPPQLPRKQQRRAQQIHQQRQQPVELSENQPRQPLHNVRALEHVRSLGAPPARAKSPPKDIHETPPSFEAGPKPGAHPARSGEDEYMRRYAKKMEQDLVSGGGSTSGHPVNGAHHPEPETIKEATKGQNLINDLNASVLSLKDELSVRQRNLQEKDAQLSNCNNDLAQIAADRDEFHQAYEQAAVLAHEQGLFVDNSRQRVQHLQQQIAQLQAELSEHQSQMESAEEAHLAFQSTADRTKIQWVEQKERHDMVAAKCSQIAGERQELERAVHNFASELQSLEAIHNMALEDENL